MSSQCREIVPISQMVPCWMFRCCTVYTSLTSISYSLFFFQLPLFPFLLFSPHTLSLPHPSSLIPHPLLPFVQYCSSVNKEWDSPVVQYYERLALLQSHPGDSITPDTMQTLFSQIQTSLVPQTILREWGEKSYATSTDYWTFRMQVYFYIMSSFSKTLQISLY